jgi:RNA polymerase sigma-B factor
MPSTTDTRAPHDRRHVSNEELFTRWHEQDDREARAALVERFMPLARKLALRYMGSNEPLDDLVQVASMGLVKAIDRYRPERGTAFTSFAVPTVLGELKRYFRDCGWALHVPRGAKELALKVESARDELTETTNRPPTLQQLAEYLEVSVEQVLDAIEVAGAHHCGSLDAPTDAEDADAATVIDMLGEIDPGYELVDARAAIKAAAIAGLSERDREVLRLRISAELSQSEIALRVGVSQMQVSRILRGAVERLSAIVEDPGVTLKHGG